MAGALDGLRVVDLSAGAGGAYCAKLLADLGADVLKVEPPDGDPLRRTGPFAATLRTRTDRCRSSPST